MCLWICVFVEHIRQSHLFCPALISCWQRGNWIVTDRAIREGGNFFLIGQSSSSSSMARSSSSSSSGQEATFSLLPMARYDTFFYNHLQWKDWIGLESFPPVYIFSSVWVQLRRGREGDSGLRQKWSFPRWLLYFLEVNIFQGWIFSRVNIFRGKKKVRGEYFSGVNMSQRLIYLRGGYFSSVNIFSRVNIFQWWIFFRGEHFSIQI